MRLRRFWAWPWELNRAGVMGLNRRQAVYSVRLNPPAHLKRVDDKLRTKVFCRAYAVPAPKTLVTVEPSDDIEEAVARLAEHDAFALKPARGAGGKGVLIVSGREGEGFRASGEVLAVDALVEHVRRGLRGRFSRGSGPDRMFAEELLIPHAAFRPIAPEGCPDLRIVLYRHTPVMAMARLPTHLSGGRGNLHQGAVGAGVDLSTGVTRDGVWRGERVTTAPDTGAPLAGVTVPDWTKVLDMAVRLSRELELGYLGVDIVVDARRGPVVLEANARPGLGIQVANQQGLLPAIREVDERSGEVE